MTIIPCEQNEALRTKIEEFSEVLKTEAHKLGSHGLGESEFYNSGLFRGAIERIRGQFSATMREKREFATRILNYLQDEGHISSWSSAGDSNRHDYSVLMPTGTLAVIELKGCLDGNNTNIFERPPQADEFIIWSVCTNPGADPRKNAWSGIHTRLSAEIVSRQQPVDGVVIWDMCCGTIGRPCPKASEERSTEVGQFLLPPPCIYLFPRTVPHARANPRPAPQQLQGVQILKAFTDCFKCKHDEINYVSFEVHHDGPETMRKTSVVRGGVDVCTSGEVSIRRR